MSASAFASQCGRRGWRRTFIGSWLRSAPKPECISAAALRARARRPMSAGQPLPSSQRSLAYSQIASESQTTRSPSCSAGTRRLGDQRATSAWNSGVSSSSRCSVKGTPWCRNSSQGRSDHEE